MRPTLWLAVLVLSGCASIPALLPDAGSREDSGLVRVDAGSAPRTDVPAGPVTADLCGALTVEGSIEIPVGTSVTVCAGSVLVVASGATITVAGTLRLAGEDGARVQLEGDPRWQGLVVTGTLEADFTDVYDAALAIDGHAGSTIRFDDGLVFARATSNARLANGGTFDRTRIVEGGTMSVTGGVLRMTDSVIDLDHPGESPDCLAVTGAGLDLDHVQLTNCHCPLHVNSASTPVSITNSILDGAAYPVMIANATGAFTGNVFSGTGAQLQDIGGPIDLDLAGNYYDGSAPVLDTDDETQFRNVEPRLTERPGDVGPRATP